MKHLTAAAQCTGQCGQSYVVCELRSMCRPFVHAMLTLVVSKQPLLELRGARGLGRIAFKAPFYCPNANKTLLDTKATIAQSGGIPALIGTGFFLLSFRSLPMIGSTIQRAYLKPVNAVVQFAKHI